MQLDRFEKLVEICAVLRRDEDFLCLAAEAFHLDFVLQQFGADAIGLGIRLVDLVDRDDHRHMRGFGVVQRLDRLRHDAVISGDDQHDDVGDLRAAGAHRRKGRVAGRIDEGDLAAERRGDLIGADMLRDAASLARDDIGLADGIEQRGLAVVDMAHNGNDGRARDEMIILIGLIEQALLDVGLGDTLDGVAHILGDDLRRIGVDRIGDLVHAALLHQQADDIDRAFRHAVREFLDGDRLGDRHLPHHLFLDLGRAALETLHAAAEGCDRARALIVAPGARRSHGEAATALFLARLGALGACRDRGLDEAGAANAWAR